MFNLSGLLSPFFHELKINNIKYCVLRGYEKLPDETRYDVDIAIDERNLSLVLSMLEDAAKHSGWTIVSSMFRDGFCRILLYHPEYEKITLPIDLMWKYQYRGARYADNELLLNDTLQYNSINVAHAGYESAISFVGKMIVGKGQEINAEKLSKIQDLAIDDEQRFASVLSSSFREDTIFELLKAIQLGNWEKAISLRGRLIKESVIKTGVMNVISNFIKSIFESAKGKIRRRGTMSVGGGLFLVLLGPDGSGKTTIAKELDKELKPLFSSSEYYHGRFHLFPQLGGIKKIFKLFSKKKHTVEETTIVKTDTTKRETLSIARASINIIYYGLEYVFAGIPIWLKLRKNTLIVSDRYFYDYLLHPEYVSAPKWLIMFFVKLIPQPDLIMLVKCDPEVIFKRKKELPLEEIERQQQLLDTFETVLGTTVSINTNQSLENTVDDAVISSLKNLNSNYCTFVEKLNKRLVGESA